MEVTGIMMKNTLGDLNNLLFAQLEKLLQNLENIKYHIDIVGLHYLEMFMDNMLFVFMEIFYFTQFHICKHIQIL